MKLKKKISGFTIVEVLIAMILASLAITFAAWTFLSVSDSFRDSKDEFSFYTEILQFRSTFSNDLDKANKVYYNNETVEILFSDSTKIFFNFHENFITREFHETIDTFHINSRNINFDFVPNKMPLLLWFSCEIYNKDKIWEQLLFYKDYTLQKQDLLFDK